MAWLVGKLHSLGWDLGVAGERWVVGVTPGPGGEMTLGDHHAEFAPSQSRNLTGETQYEHCRGRWYVVFAGVLACTYVLVMQ